MKYYFKLLIWKFTVSVLINDYMFLINDKEIVNTTYVSKFGINLAKVVLLYKKKYNYLSKSRGNSQINKIR